MQEIGRALNILFVNEKNPTIWILKPLYASIKPKCCRCKKVTKFHRPSASGFKNREGNALPG